MPDEEPGRLAALRAPNILDTPPDVAYDEIGELAAQICRCSIGYISFIDWKAAELTSEPSLALLNLRWSARHNVTKGQLDCERVIYC
jgi:hypothetical protein